MILQDVRYDRLKKNMSKCPDIAVVDCCGDIDRRSSVVLDELQRRESQI